MKEFFGHVVQTVEAEKIMGFQLGPLVSTAAIAQARGRAMVALMNQFKIILTSDLSRKQKLDKYFTLVSKGMWGIHLLALKPSNFAHLG